MPPKTRTFICITPPNQVIKEIARLQPIIQKQNFIGKLTELENLHLTLKFLGEISEEKLQQTRKLLQKIKFPPFKAKLLHLGTFKYKSHPKIVWIKIGGKEILELQKTIDKSLFPIYEKESRFMSHLTIARIKHSPSPKTFEEHIKKIKPKTIEFPINSFQLKSSKLNSLGPVYETLETYPLKQPNTQIP